MFISYDEWKKEFFPSSQLPKREVKRLVESGHLPGFVLDKHVFICYGSWQKIKPNANKNSDLTPVKPDAIRMSLDKLNICE